MKRDQPKSFVVHGTVANADGLPLSKVLVTAFDQDLRHRQELGRCSTDGKGEYRIEYSAKQFRRAEKEAADLVVCSSDVESEIVFNAARIEVINLKVPGGPSEYALLRSALAPLIEQLPHHELTEQDFAFLVGESGLPVERIRALGDAARLGLELQDMVPAEAVYGLIRQGVASRVDAILATPSEEIVQLLMASSRSHQIDRDFENAAQEIAETLRIAAVGHDVKRFEDIFATTEVRPDAQRVFTALFREHSGAQTELWTKLSAHPDIQEHEAQEIRLAVDVGTITGRHAPLMASLQAERREREASDWGYLAARTPEDWAVFSESMQIPVPDSFGDSAVAYGRHLARMVEKQHPTAVVTENINRADNMPLRARAEVVTFLRATRDFDLTATPVRTYFDHNEAALGNMDDPKAVIGDLEAIQRVRRIAKNAAETTFLLTNGYQDARSIATIDKQTFVKRHANEMSLAAAARIHDESVGRAAAAQDLILRLRDAYTEPRPDALGSSDHDEDLRPEWREMFGAIDYCACEACRSIIGPAAYLVDQLEFLDERMGRPIDVLLSRRPDLAHIELDCPNANTVLPYVDLVIEILERAVTGTSAPWPQTSAEPGTEAASLLLAEPEHLDEAVYTELRDGVVFPWHLPFDLWAELVRAYLSHLGPTRAELLQAFESSEGPMEWLGMTPIQWGLAVGTTSASAWRSWGYSGPRTSPPPVADLLHRAELDFAELDLLSNNTFVGPFRMSGQETCDTHRMFIVDLDESMLDRMHRFLRLKRSLKWSDDLLESAISALGEGRLDDPFLRQLALVKQVAHRLQWQDAEAVAFFVPETSPALIAQQRGRFASAIGVSLEDLDRLVAWGGAQPQSAPAVALQLIDAARLVVALGLSVEDVARMLGELAAEPDPAKVDALTRELGRVGPGAGRIALASEMGAEAVGLPLAFVEELFTTYPDLVAGFVDVESDGSMPGLVVALSELQRWAFVLDRIHLTDAEWASLVVATDVDGRLNSSAWFAWVASLDRVPSSLRRSVLEQLAEAGVDETMARRWAETMPDRSLADEIKSVARGRSTPSEWPEVGRKIREPIRNAQLDALLHYLLQTQEIGTPSDAYARFLVDPEMTACAVTSRIKLAHGSVQLFVQRALMNLEPEVSADREVDPGWQQWAWRKNFGVWSAARRIFLHPENWVEPSLRDDKTPFFKSLETNLLQEDLTESRAQAALRGYLEQLATVAQLEISAATTEHRGESEIVHVFGRTTGTPPVYYYRREVSNLHSRYWTPWEEVMLDVDEGSYLMPVVWNQQLYVVFPQFIETTRSVGITIREGEDLSPPEPTIEVRFGFSRYEKGKWSEKRYFDDVTSINPGNREFLRLVAGEVDGSLKIQLYPGSLPRGDHWYYELRVASPSSPARHSSLTGVLPTLPHTSPRGSYLESHNNRLRLFPDFNRDILRHPTTDENFRIVLADGAATFGPRPAIIQDDERSFWVGNWSEDWSLPPDLEATVRDLMEIPLLGWLAAAMLVIDYYEGLEFTYTFEPFYHPFAHALLAELDRKGLRGMFERDVQIDPATFLDRPPFDFVGFYSANRSRIGEIPVESIDFSRTGAYAQYNWEVFVHLPLRIASHLTKNQRFSEAQQYLHLVFDPTSMQGPANAARYWNSKPFFEAMRDGIDSGYPALLREVERWEADPTEPHRIARARTLAYPKAVVMQYLDNLIAWADHLFAQDTIESINEGTQLYLLAAGILGSRPQEVTGAAPLSRTYAQLREHVDEFGNAVLGLAENLVPEAASVRPAAYDDGAGARVPSEVEQPRVWLRHILYFCLPKNEKLLTYWDILEDRLFKIRHCQNLDGRVRELNLYEAPLDPALLVRARASGVDLRDALDAGGLRSPYRFRVVLRKAIEFASEVRSLGSALLSVLEKRDSEALALLRAGQEVRVSDIVRQTRNSQIDEAIHGKRSLESNRLLVEHRRQTYATREPLNAGEIAQLALLSQALVLEEVAGGLDLAANILQLIPDFKVGAPFTVGALFGGNNLGPALRAFGSFTRSKGSILGMAASMSATLASHQRRQEDWDLQATLAEKELDQIDSQLEAAEVRLEMARHELAAHDRRAEDARVVRETLESKHTNEALYDWMVGQVSLIYFQSYQLAHAMAKRAEQALRFELGLEADGTDFIRAGYWDSLKKGLLAGEKLRYDLVRLEAFEIESRARAYEITKHISLAAIDPLALARLIETGETEFSIPEIVFDLDHPGHYLRRIKSLSVTFPAVTGPYVGVPCSLQLERSQTRVSAETAPDYHPSDDADPRFARDWVGQESIVTSRGVDDPGMFELRLEDDRYLPFEGAGVVSTWRVKLPKDVRPFDYRSMTDVVLHMRYTSHDGGPDLHAAALVATRNTLNGVADAVGAAPAGMLQVLSARRNFSNEWYRFSRALEAADPALLELPVTEQDFPAFIHGRRVSGLSLTMVVSSQGEGGLPPTTLTTPGASASMPLLWSAMPDASSAYVATRELLAGSDVMGPWTVQMTPTDAARIEDILFVFHYRLHV